MATVGTRVDVLVADAPSDCDGVGEIVAEGVCVALRDGVADGVGEGEREGDGV